MTNEEMCRLLIDNTNAKWVMKEYRQKELERQRCVARFNRSIVRHMKEYGMSEEKAVETVKQRNREKALYAIRKKTIQRYK